MEVRLAVNGEDVGKVWADVWSPAVWQWDNGCPTDKWEVTVDGVVHRTSEDREDE